MRFSYVQILLIFLVSATTHSISFVQGSTTFVRRRKKQRTSSKMVATFLQEELIPSVVGAVSFYGTLALSTCLQKSIGVTTADKMLARMIGFPSVCVASVVSVRSVRFTQEIQRDSLSWKDLNKKKLLSFHPPPHSSNQFYNVGFVSLPKEDVHAYVSNCYPTLVDCMDSISFLTCCPLRLVLDAYLGWEHSSYWGVVSGGSHQAHMLAQEVMLGILSQQRKNTSKVNER